MTDESLSSPEEQLPADTDDDPSPNSSEVTAAEPDGPSEVAPAAGPRVELPSRSELEQVEQVEQATFQPDAFQPGPSILGAIAFGLAGAVAWAFITYVTEHELGIIAILLGILTGVGAARGGRTPQSQIVGAVTAGVCYFVAQFFVVYAIVGDSAVLTEPTVVWAVLQELVKETFSSMGVLFLGIAIYEGYRIPRPR